MVQTTKKQEAFENIQSCSFFLKLRSCFYWNLHLALCIHLVILKETPEALCMYKNDYSHNKGSMRLFTSQRKKRARMICSGADHSMFRKVVRSMNRWASTDIRLTTSPTVDERLASFVITSACERCHP